MMIKFLLCRINVFCLIGTEESNVVMQLNLLFFQSLLVIKNEYIHPLHLL